MTTSEPQGKIWTRLIKPTSMMSAFHMFSNKKSTLFLHDLCLSQLWDFYQARSALVTFYTFRNGYQSGWYCWKCIGEYFQGIVLNNIYLVITKMSCIISFHQKLIFTVMQMQIMHVAVDMNYHINAQYKKTHIVFQLVIICCFDVYIRFRGIGRSRFG